MKKPYIQLAATLASLGAALFFLERFALSELQGVNGGQGVHLDPNLLSLLVIAPFALFLAAAIVFMVGKMRRL
ncbi:MAG: hypothetical protein EON57_04775 [Alphaproteobacteria bacterium]|nr:MAG: hypothetical protein EON57_04775 [Alphaproteobacteria bacterium]